MKLSWMLPPVMLAALALSACSQPPAPEAATSQRSAQPAQAGSAPAVPTAAAPAPAAALPKMVVHKTASCGCCTLWADRMRDAGFALEMIDENDLGPVKERVGIPAGKGSCHTAEVGGYFIEGHVPAEDIKRLLAERPDAKGLVLPGMPAGSPGMEMPDGRTRSYTVELVRRDGSTTPFAQH